MPKKGHTEEQIVAVLRQVEAGARVAQICRKVGISEGLATRRVIEQQKQLPA
jgi:transposase-like protein